MIIDKLEEELRAENRFSEDEIRQILSFIFSLNQYLQPVIYKTPCYFNKYLVFRASNFYKSISRTNAVYVKIFEDNIASILDELLLESSDGSVEKNYFLEKAKEKIIKAICGMQQKIMDISNKALEEAVIGVNLAKDQVDAIRALFNERLKFQLKENK